MVVNDVVCAQRTDVGVVAGLAVAMTVYPAYFASWMAVARVNTSTFRSSNDAYVPNDPTDELPPQTRSDLPVLGAGPFAGSATPSVATRLAPAVTNASGTVAPSSNV